MAKAVNDFNRTWTEERSHYWLVYKKFHFYEDVTGNEYMNIQRDIREAVAEVRRQLEEHQIAIWISNQINNLIIWLSIVHKAKWDQIVF